MQKIENNIEKNDNAYDIIGKDVHNVNLGSNKNSTQSLNTSMLDYDGVVQDDEEVQEEGTLIPKPELKLQRMGSPNGSWNWI